MKDVGFDEIQALFSTECVCGKKKNEARSFCLSCYRSLPPEIRSALYRRSGFGYEEAVAQAVEALGISGSRLRLYSENLETKLRADIASRLFVDSEEQP